MRILRGLSSRFLACGCVVGIYETYDSQTVAILDTKATDCADSAHEQGKQLPDAVAASAAVPPASRSSHHPTEP
jgi:hypothetical protein